MSDILYIATDAENMKRLEPLWEASKNYHVSRATYFKKEMASKTWACRCREILEKAEGGRLRVDLAYDGDVVIGYCISTLTRDGEGEIQSIYIEEDYRYRGIGTSFIKRADRWFDILGAKQRLVNVAEGNEDVIPFYNKFGYFTRMTVLHKVDDQDSGV